jgi:hypothetical protein
MKIIKLKQFDCEQDCVNKKMRRETDAKQKRLTPQPGFSQKLHESFS